MKLDGINTIKLMEFDIPGRKLTIIHEGEPSELLDKLIPLNFGTTLVESRATTSSVELLEADHENEAKILRILLILNGSMFVIELMLGLYAQSMGLISDSLDMLADAIVYGLSLYAVGKAISQKHRAAKFSGYFQMILSLGVLVEAVRRFFYGSEALGSLMIGVSLLALLVNVACLALISKHKDGEVHMKASWIFSANDVIANLGVIVAGGLVMLTGSSIPDLVIGVIVSLIVFKGSLTILKL
jgi:cation diffusion facilitator family transporter